MGNMVVYNKTFFLCSMLGEVEEKQEREGEKIQILSGSHWNSSQILKAI